MAKLLLWKKMEITNDAAGQKGGRAARTETQPDIEPCSTPSKAITFGSPDGEGSEVWLCTEVTLSLETHGCGRQNFSDWP